MGQWDEMASEVARRIRRKIMITQMIRIASVSVGVPKTTLWIDHSLVAEEFNALLMELIQDGYLEFSDSLSRRGKPLLRATGKVFS